MSHAEALQTLHPAAGATDAVVGFVSALRHEHIPEEARHYARRHLLDTVGVMIAGAGGEVATRAEAVLSAVRPAGPAPGPRPPRRAGLRACAFFFRTPPHRTDAARGLPPGLLQSRRVGVAAVVSARAG